MASDFSCHVDAEDKPRVHVGDGQWLHAISRLWVQKRIDQVGTSVPEAPKLPILNGGDLLDDWGAVISYGGNEMVLESKPGKPILPFMR